MYASDESSSSDDDGVTVLQLGARAPSPRPRSPASPAPRPRLDVSNAPDDPLALLLAWLNQPPPARPSAALLSAGGAHPPIAFAPQPIAVLSTVDASDGVPRPAARTVSLKSYSRDGLLLFHTNLGSPKARQLAANPACALVLQLPLPEAGRSRQIVVHGRAALLPGPERESIWAGLSEGQKLREHRAPRMSSRVTREEVLADASYTGPVGTAPDFWGCFAVSADRWEFWEGGSTPELHDVDRVVYERAVAGAWAGERVVQGAGGSWVLSRLAP
ncbi:hypothetical protein DFJ74DRAFT_714426 [Hyaloraphidium curvatum]|nr:hypothetical protein DFJ74DRAFT_714426 [Hyaloraphidium curvatum]